MRLAAPDLGEHTEEALRGLGLPADRIAELKKRQVV
jgi:crotonobetainyl-CoA:carnitine CoA-transferase CaiB-like acyl-CoA transferase